MSSNYFDGLNLKLLDAIPDHAKCVLELGCANGKLGRRFKELHPGVTWVGVELQHEAALCAQQYLDRVEELDCDLIDFSQFDGCFDTIVIGDLLEHVRNPARLLEGLHQIAEPDAQIICSLPNMAHLSVIERLVACDITYDELGLLDSTHLRFYSPSSAFKTFLDAGWLPNLEDQYRTELPQTPFSAKILEAAQLLGLHPDTALHNFGCYQMIIVCKKWLKEALEGQQNPKPISVIVPVNRPWQFDLNIVRSPGLKEINAEVIPVFGANSAANTYALGLEQVHHTWHLLAHQDVYFPPGSGYALVNQLNLLELAGRTGGPVGFAGLASSGAGNGSERKAGLVIDRTNLFCHSGTNAALSIDELAIALHREAIVSIDHNLGWHLWGTDLCLQAMTSSQSRDLASIVRVPLYHNSVSGYQLPEAFYASAKVLLDKYPRLNRIATLCGEIQRNTAFTNEGQNYLPKSTIRLST